MADKVFMILSAIIGVAIIAVLVSNQAQTSNVIKSAGSAFGGIIKAAESPLGGLGSSLSIGS